MEKFGRRGGSVDHFYTRLTMGGLQSYKAIYRKKIITNFSVYPAFFPIFWISSIFVQAKIVSDSQVHWVLVKGLSLVFHKVPRLSYFLKIVCEEVKINLRNNFKQKHHIIRNKLNQLSNQFRFLIIRMLLLGPLHNWTKNLV